MFPGISGFHWSPGHVIFLACFLAAATILAITLVTAWARSARDLRAGRAQAIRWNEDFEDLAAGDRGCRHAITGELPGRVCENAFDCGHCAKHAECVKLHPVAAAADDEIYGLQFPADRMYDRGHTWVKEERDGTVLVGLDDLGARVLGQSYEVELPAAGTRLERNGVAWTVRRGPARVRILSPVSGEVVESGERCVRVRPSDRNFGHLLRGAEVQPWVSRELERLQLALRLPATGPSLADGGVLVEDLPNNYPAADWDAVWGDVFLEP